MKILVNASVSGLVENGFLVYCRELLKELLPMLEARGHETVLLLPRGSLLDEFNVGKIYLPAICGTPRKRSPLNPICRLFYNLLVVPLLSRRFDLAYSLTPHGMAWGRCPQLLTVHDLIPLEFPAQHRLQHYYTRLCLPFVVRHSRRVICISETTRGLLADRLRCPESKTCVVYNGCSGGFAPVEGAADLVAAKYGVRDYVLACGVGFPHKNIRFLISCYARLPRDVQEGHPLLVVGVNTDPYAQSLMRLAADLPCSSFIRFAGMVPNGDMPMLYSAARLFVYPTLSEGFGMPPIEAMRCGTPCLASNLPIMKEVLQLPDEDYFDPAVEEDLVGKLRRRLLQGGKLQPECMVRAKCFSWRVAASSVADEIAGFAR